MKREIHLDGGDIMILKALGTSGTPMSGQLLRRRLKDMSKTELLEALESLLALDYILSTKVNLRDVDDVDQSSFRVNGAHARDLRDALRGKRPDADKGRRPRRG